MKKTISLILITVCAVIIPMKVSAQGSGYAPDGVVMNKYVNPVVGSPYNFLIDLETFVTGGSETTFGSEPSDVILLLDCSGSMIESFGSTSRISALKSAACGFVDILVNNTNNKIGVVSFSDEASVKYHVNNSLDANSIKNVINGINPNGGTRSDEGFRAVVTLFSERSQTTYIASDGSIKDRKQIVIFFTDGLPGNGEAEDDYFGYPLSDQHVYQAPGENVEVANAAIKQTDILKNNNTTIYAIGIHSKCNPATDINFAIRAKDNYWSQMGFGTFHWDVLSTKSQGMNAYMHFVSSDYGICGDMYGPDRSTVENNGYYYSASNANELNEVFSNIGSQIVVGGSDYNLPAAGTTVVDVISADFMLPEGATSDDIGLYVAQCNGVTTNPDDTKSYSFSERVPAQSLFPNVNAVISNENRISVTGFDFSENYVGEDIDGGTSVARGYKLIIEIPIQVAPGSSGGASLLTNAIGSGIFYDADGDGTPEQIAEFNYPSVKIPNVVIVKKGLKSGESALFKVQKLEESGNAVESPIQIVLTQREGTETVGVLRLATPGRYKVEEMDWSWAYDISSVTGTYTKEDLSKTTAEWNSIGFGDYSEGYQYPIPGTFGTETTANSITRNVNDFTEDYYESNKGTLFIFTNSAKSETLKHAEDVKQNEFNVSDIN